MAELTEFILNVDDYSPGRYARTKVLQQAGFSVLEAASGKETLQILANHKPGLVLLDVNLPDMSGFDVCRQIRRNPETTMMTIVHISASSIQNYHQVDGLEAGADSYLVEPIDPSVLVATIRAFLRTRKAEDALRKSNAELEWFAYRAAHDLNEPLRTITAHTQLLEQKLKGQLDERASESFNFVLNAAERMKSFIDGLLRYATVTHGAMRVTMVECDAILDRAIANLETAIQTSGAKITHDALPVVIADDGLEEVFQNLIGNSIKYRRENVVPEIHISARAESRSRGIRCYGAGQRDRHRTTTYSSHLQHVPPLARA